MSDDISMTTFLGNADQQIGGAEVHQPHWVSRSAFQIMVIALLLSQIGLFASVQAGWIWLAFPLALVTSHFSHGLLIGFHEASHGSLRKNRRFNEFDGVLLGIFSFTSFSLYRAAHQTHHMHLATERDEELWPFVVPTMPRWKRCLAAFCELTLALFYTPFLFIRTFLRKNSPIRAKKVRRRIWMEFALMIAVWTTLLSLVAFFGVWKYFLWMFLVPGFVAANLQSVRKYIEHVGMTGDTPNSATRSIVAPTWMGKLVAFTLLHEPFHGVHHENPGLPHAELPLHVAGLAPKEPNDVPPFPSYRHAFLHLLRSLADPKVGPQWQR